MGRHSTKNLDDNYMGSGNWVKQCKKNKVILYKEILSYHNTEQELIEAEQTLLNEFFKTENCMNFTNNSAGFSIGDTNPSKSEKERKRRSEFNWMKTPEGSKFLSERNKTYFKDPKNREKQSKTISNLWHDPEYRKNYEGDNHYLHKPEHKHLIEKMKTNNPMFKPEIREKLSLIHKGKIQNTITCPHCLKIGSVSNMKRWHFDNCRTTQ